MRYKKEPVSFTASRDVIQFLNGMNKGRKSEFINQTLREKITKRKNPRQYIAEIHKEVLLKVDEIGRLKSKIAMIQNEFEISDEELDNIQEYVYRQVESSKKDSVQEEQTQLIQNAN